MARHVVAFTGEDENGILAELSAGFMGALRPMGLSGHVIDLCVPGWPDRLLPLAREGLVMGWGSAGIGASLEIDGRNLWDMLEVPFVSTLADTPCQLPQNHRVPSRWVGNGYMARDWMEMQRRFIRAPQVAAVLPVGVMANPQRGLLPWARRPHRMIFVKTGEDPARRRAGWEDSPALLRAVLNEAADAACRRPTGAIAEVLLEAAEALDLHLVERPDLFFAVMREVDRYVRARRAEVFAKALLPLGGLIIGRGWDYLDTSGARATVVGAIPAPVLPGLYAETQWLVSTNPNFSHGVHERIPGGFAAGCCVVSDDNAYTRDRFGMLPAFHGLDWTEPDLGESLAALWADDRDRGEEAAEAVAVADRDFAPSAFLRGMLDLAHLVRAANALESEAA